MVYYFGRNAFGRLGVGCLGNLLSKGQIEHSGCGLKPSKNGTLPSGLVAKATDRVRHTIFDKKATGTKYSSPLRPTIVVRALMTVEKLGFLHGHRTIHTA